MQADERLSQSSAQRTQRRGVRRKDDCRVFASHAREDRRGDAHLEGAHVFVHDGLSCEIILVRLHCAEHRQRRRTRGVEHDVLALRRQGIAQKRPRAVHHRIGQQCAQPRRRVFARLRGVAARARGSSGDKSVETAVLLREHDGPREAFRKLRCGDAVQGASMHESDNVEYILRMIADGSSREAHAQRSREAHHRLRPLRRGILQQVNLVNDEQLALAEQIAQRVSGAGAPSRAYRDTSFVRQHDHATGVSPRREYHTRAFCAQYGRVTAEGEQSELGKTPVLAAPIEHNTRRAYDRHPVGAQRVHPLRECQRGERLTETHLEGKDSAVSRGRTLFQERNPLLLMRLENRRPLARRSATITDCGRQVALLRSETHHAPPHDTFIQVRLTARQAAQHRLCRKTSTGRVVLHAELAALGRVAVRRCERVVASGCQQDFDVDLHDAELLKQAACAVVRRVLAVVQGFDDALFRVEEILHATFVT